MRVGVLNTSVLTSPGHYTLRPLTVEDARALAQITVKVGELVSAVGHEATAELLSDLLQAPVPVARIPYEQGPGEEAIVFKLRGRLPEGAVHTPDQITEFGFDLFLLVRHDPRVTAQDTIGYRQGADGMAVCGQCILEHPDGWRRDIPIRRQDLSFEPGALRPWATCMSCAGALDPELSAARAVPA